MSKKKLILLILAATLTVALVVGGIVLAVNLAKSGGDENPTEQPTETIDGDKSQWTACKHEYDDENDPDCNLCGERRVPENHEEHGEHVYDSNVGGGHVCTICGHDKTLDKCVHAYDNACDPDCNLCGETREPAEHVAEVVEGKEPTCTESGLTSGKICSVCGKVLEQQTIIDAIGHEFVDDYTYDNDNHWHACARCDAVKDKAAHTLDADGNCVCGFNTKQLTCEHPDGRSEWRVTTAATCLSDGVETLFCLDCNKKLGTRSIPKGDHVPSEAVRENVVEATCTVAGSYDSVIYCSACHIEISRTTEAIESLGHKWSDTYKYDTENHWRVCERDGCEETGDKAAHTIGADGRCMCGYDLGCVHANTEWRVVSPATCTKEGSEEQVCKDCNTILGTRTVDKLEHTPTDAIVEDIIIASCENPSSYYEVRYCRDCGTEISRNYIVGVASLGHNYGHAYKFDTTGHWNVCTRCGKADNKIAHDTGDGTLCICGYDSNCKHESCTWVVSKEGTCISYGEEEYVCDACGIVLNKRYDYIFADHTPDEAHKENIKYATCTTDGSYDSVVSCKYCSCVISRERMIERSKGHTPSETYNYNTENHWKYCEVCKEVIQIGTHSIGSDYYCTVCGYYSKCTHPTDKLSGWMILYAPTCEHSGYEYRMCGDCHALVDEKYTDKLPHTYITAEENRVEATCENDGSYDRVTYCKDCGYELNRTTEVIAGGHKEYVIPGKAPTCTESGYTSSSVCLICGEYIEFEEFLPATGHTEVSIPAISATCTTVGYSAGMKCSECGEVTIAPTEIKALGHKWSSIYSSNVEEHWRVCTRDGCGAEDTREAHSFNSESVCTLCGYNCEKHTELGEWTVVTESTCTEKGVEVRYCLSCGAVAEERELDLASHVPDIDAATCTQDKVCVNCNTKLEDALGHDESGDWESDESGHWKICARCNEKIKEDKHINSITTATCIKDMVCTTCNRILEAKKGHSYNGDCGTVCENCGAKRESAGAHTEVTIDAVEASCTTPGKTEGKKCSVCGEITVAQTTILPLGHSYELKHNETTHWKECTRANCDKKTESGAYKSEVSEHNYAYSCSKTCRVCGYEREAAHVYESNCSNTCTICNKVTRIAPHTYRADCVDTCSSCGNERTNVAAHYYEYECSDTCVKCGGKRTDVKHTYDSDCDASCNVCGEFRTVDGHEYSNAWTSGKTAHYKVCTVEGCNAKSMVTAHTYSRACSGTCSGCGLETREAKHVYSNACDKTCDICGETREVDAHKYAEKYAYNEQGYHYRMCSICGTQDPNTYEQHTSYKDGICETCGYNSNKPCTHAGAKACEETCQECGISLSNRAEHKRETIITDYGHYYKCSVCGLETGLQEHVTTVYQIKVDGVTRGTGSGESVNASAHKIACIVCDTVVKEEIQHDFVHDGVCECGYVAECEHEGGTATCNKLAICGKCGCGYGSYAAHTPKETQSRLEAGCTTTGLTAEMTCSICNKVLEEATVIPAKGHNMVPVSGYSASCTSTGKTEGKACSVCGEVEVEQTVIPQKDHSYRQSSYTSPTCESNGSIVYVCVYCGTSKTETVKLTGHDYGEAWYITKQATCDSEGEKVQICKNCGGHGAPETIDALGHKWGEETTIAPTCENGGYTYKICSVCKVEAQSTPTPATGHTKEEKERHEAGCLTDGYVVYYCKICQKTLSTEIISAKGAHTWDETKYESGENGHWRKCSAEGCEGISEVTSHTYKDGKCTVCEYGCNHRGGKATCMALATCEICGEAYGEYAAHEWKDATCTKAKTCTICGATDGEANGHTEVIDNAVAPTCTKNGLEEGSHCGVCHEIIKKQEPVSATGHTYGEDGKCTICGYDSSEDQGCEHKYNGCTDRVCTNCGHLRPEADAQHVLTYVGGKSATCTVEGAEPAQKCTACGKMFSLDGEEITEQKAIAVLGHDYIWIVQSVATCQSEGSKYQSCTRCGDTGETVTTEKTEHDYVTITVESTCTTLGYTTTTCKVCASGTTTKSETYKAHTAGQWIPDTDATCTEKGSEYAICAVCSQPTGETRDIAPLGHSEIKKVYAPTCTADGYETYTCTRCSNIRTVTDEGTAKGHTEGNWVIELAPTCDTSGMKLRSCAVCGVSMTGTRVAIEAEGHNYVSETVAATCTQEGKVTYSCSKCGQANDDMTETLAKIPHNYGDFNVGLAATCLDDGWSYRGCTVCGAQEIYTIEKLGHNEVVTIVGGYRVTTCSICHLETQERVPVQTTGHTCNGNGGYRVVTEASCGVSGIKYAICSICGEDYGDAITTDALEHDWVITVVAPTCKDQGVTTKTCNLCGVNEETYQNKLEHVDGGYVVDYDASCTEAGQKHKICKNCEETIEGTYEEIPAKGHKYTLTKVVVADCENGGYTEYTCSACNGTVTKDETDALDHTDGGWIIDTAASCTDSGSRHQVCARCGETIKTETIEPTEHSYIDIVVSATCTEQGYTLHTCKNCGYSNADTYVTALGHKSSDWIIEKDATCTEAGEKYTVCTVCGSRDQSGEIPAKGHDYKAVNTVAPTCTEDGYTIYVCSGCLDSYNDNKVTSSGHIYDAGGKTCTVCGYVKQDNVTCEHDYYYECSARCYKCGEVREGYEDGDKHVLKKLEAVESTCTKTGLTEGEYCTICDTVTKRQEVTAMKSHTYKYSCSDECSVCHTKRTTTGHKYTYACDTVCNICGQTTREEATHKFDNNCDTTCNWCGKTRVELNLTVYKHVYTTGEYKNNLSGHWQVCTECGAKSEVQAHVYSEDTARGDNHYVCYDTECDVCGYTREVTHTLNDQNICTECGYKVTCNHVYDDCLDTDCNLCGAKREAPGHKGGTATCTAYAVCEVCLKTYGDKAAHTPNIPAATCEDNQVCTVCKRTIAKATGHNYTSVVTEPTCTERGYTTSTCSKCNDVKVGSYVAALGHTLVTIEGKAATCTEQGLTDGKQCKVCKIWTVPQTVIAAKGHSYKDGVCTVCDKEKPVCNHVYDDDCDTTCNVEGCGEIRVAPHYYGDNFVTSADMSSMHWKECSKCKAKTQISEHTYGDYQSTEGGSTHWRICSACEYKNEANHQFSEAYTSDASGHWHVCAICKAISTKNKHDFEYECSTTCSTCNFKRTVNHDFSGEYVTDGTYHWKECQKPNCDAVSSKAAHAFGSYQSDVTDATSHYKICSDCKYKSTSKHQTSTTWTSDGGTTHYQLCSICGARINSAEHSYQYTCSTTCSVCKNYDPSRTHKFANDCATVCEYGCGYTRAAKHSYSTMWTQGDTQHWYECSGCGAKRLAADHVFANDCSTACSICGKTRATLDSGEKAGHIWSTKWSYTAQKHYHACTRSGCSEKNDEAEHNYGDNECGTTCNTCGYTRTVTHTWETGWSCDDDYHFKKCTKSGCSERYQETGHSYTNDCDTDCNICGATRTTEHDYSGAYVSDANNHWKVCKNCGAKAETAGHVVDFDCDAECKVCKRQRNVSHSFDNACDTDCNYGCGYTRAASHSYSTVYSNDSANHWQECVVCNKNEARRNVGAHTYNGNGTTCDTCGYNKTISHNWSKDYKSDGTYHWLYCTDAGCTEVSGKAVHVGFSSCTTKDCKTCGYVRAESEIKHTYNEAIWNEETVTENGVEVTYHYHACMICGDKNGSRGKHDYDNGCDTDCNICGLLRAAQHTYDNACDSDCNECGATRTAPHAYGTAYVNTDADEHWLECSLCHTKKNIAGHIYDNTCDAYCNVCYHERDVEHTESTTWSRDADGHWKVCTICGATVVTKVKHDFANACDDRCDECGLTRTVGDHVYETDWVKTDDNYHWHKCKYCGRAKDKAPHDFGNACATTCKVCGKTRAAAQHDYAKTLTWDGSSHWYACINCGAKSQEVDHQWSNDCDTTCNTAGCGYTRETSHKWGEKKLYDPNNHWTECSVCGETKDKSSHDWTTDCDTMCDTCGYTRSTVHSFSSSYKYESATGNHWRYCLKCGEKMTSSISSHDWSNNCDTQCDTCGCTRTITHTYDNDCDTTCNVCGNVRNITHNYPSDRTYNDTYHWYQCTVCGNRKGETTHTYASSSATKCSGCAKTRVIGECEHVYDNPCLDKTCNKCGKIRTEFSPHVYASVCSSECTYCGTARVAPHNYQYTCSTTCQSCSATRTASHSYSGAKYQSDADNHWQACMYGCGTKNTASAHKYSGTCGSICTVCGYERASTHTWNETWSTDANYHWYECSGCAQKKDYVQHYYTNNCDTSCNGCGYIRSITHQWQDGYTNDADYHWQVCTVCSAIQKKATHGYSTVSVSDTQHKRYCTVCGYIQSTESHTFTDGACTSCGAKEIINEGYATSVDFINLNGPLTGYGSNTDNQTSFKGFGTDLNCKLSINGWCVTNTGILGYYYSIDDGETWTAITSGILTDAGTVHVNSAMGYGVSEDAPTANCVFQSLSIDLSAYKGQTLNVIFAAQAKSKAYVRIITLEGVKVWDYTTSGQTTVDNDVNNGTAKAYAIDKLMINGRIWKVHNTNAMGTAAAPYAQNHTAVTVNSGDYVTLSGWLGYKDQTILSFGYCFADSPTTRVLNSTFVGAAETGVINSGGANAKRFTIDVDTASLSVGVHRVYFVVQLSNGKYPIIHYVDIYVTGSGSGWTADDGDTIVEAKKDETKDFNTAPNSVSGGTYTFNNGFTYIDGDGNSTASNLVFTSSSSYTGASTYRFNMTSSGTTLTFNESMFTGTFNRFKLRYSSSVNAKLVMTYKMSGGSYTDTFYLEPGQGTFTSVVKGYLDGDMIDSITSITVTPLGASSGTFMLAGLVTEQYTVYGKDLTYLENTRFRVGVRLSWGGALCYYEDKNDGMSDLSNLINAYDVGRLVQQSWYMNGKNTGNYNGQVWKYNPVQGGDWNNNESRLIDVVVGQCSLYVKCQPMDWGAGSDGSTYTISQSYMENWYTLNSDMLRVDNRFYDFSGINSTSAINQEIPALYFIGYLNTFVYSTTGNVNDATNIAYKTNLPFWGNNPSAADYDSNYNALTRFTVSGNQVWGAWYNSSSNFGIGFYTPGVARLISGRNDHSVYGDTKSPYSPGCSYTATGVDCKLMSYKAYTYSYMLTTGNINTIRTTFAKHANEIPSHNLSS